MKLYLDDDVVARQLIALLREAGHTPVIPAEAGKDGASDPIHLAYAVRQKLPLLTRNHKDFEELHDLILAADGHHPGLLVLRADSNQKHRLRHSQIVRAITNLQKSGTVMADQVFTLNHWQ